MRRRFSLPIIYMDLVKNVSVTAVLDPEVVFLENVFLILLEVAYLCFWLLFMVATSLW